MVMVMVELELKFALTDSMAAEFEQRASLGLTSPQKQLWSRYFDTSAGDLMNAGVSLRLRRTPQGFIQTVKGEGSGPFERFEWEKPVPGEALCRDLLPPENHPAGMLTRECFSLLMPVFETDFARQVRLVRPQPDVRVEIACDRGEIRIGPRSERTEPIAEVELELKEGAAAAFYHYAMQWADLHQARLLLASKSTRGLQLAGWQSEHPGAVKPVTLSPAADTPTVVAAQQILIGHLNHFLANVRPVSTGTQAQGPHQLRVALRRFRSAIRFFDLRRTAVRDDDSVGAADDVATVWRDLDQRASALADAAAFVRDADVLERGLLARLDKTFPGDAALHVLGRSLASERERHRAELRKTIGSAEMSAFVLRAYAAAGSLPSEHWQATTYGDYAAGRLAFLVRRVRKRAAAARVESDWHEVRIAIKNLRYALDGCRALDVTTAPVRVAVARLSRWQDELGSGQDLAVARGIAAQALAHTAVPTEMMVRATALVDGYRAFATRNETSARVRKTIRGDLKRFLAAAPKSPRNATTGSGYHVEDGPSPAEPTLEKAIGNETREEESE